MADISDLPTEILIIIFRFYVETEKQVQLLRILAKVCLKWKTICLDSALWSKYDGTPSFRKMKYLSEVGSLSKTKELIMSRIESLKKVDENKLFSSMQNVEVISFSNVKQISRNTLSAVAENCTKLREIQLGRYGRKKVKLNYNMLESFLVVRGYGLVKIDISYSQVGNSPLIMHCISDFCPNLEHLKLINIIGSVGMFPTKYFQSHCPKLKFLHLDHKVSIQNDRYSSGFPDLEMFIYVDFGGRTISDRELESVLFNSSKLKLLSLTNCDISADVLCSLPACSVEYLYLSRCSVCDSEALSDVLKKWDNTLRQVDISYGNSSALNDGIFYLVTYPVQSQLEILNLNFTKIIL